ncbi:MAG TPA: FliA/WhiG family RNA polymerase sigma factor [Clostridia bacterium]|nr:FliA/WhiG family RNA polymerase sigma factor [Clostridia bacterium]
MKTQLPPTESLALLENYLKAPSVALRNDLVMQYSYIPKTVAAQMRGITASYAEVEDIVNNGIITLIDCIERFDPLKSGNFESYAFSRIKCANIDFIRKQDWLPRRVRKTARDITAAYDELANKLMRVPSVKELADHLCVDESMVYKHYREISNSVLLSFEMLLSSVAENGEIDAAGDFEQPESSLIRSELHQKLMKAIDALSERDRLVISLYYFEHLKLHEIAEVLKVSEARVCQARSKAILKLRSFLHDYLEG